MINEYLNYLQEGYLLSDKTIGVNISQFIDRKKKKFLIFGMAGSGKTTLGEALSKRLRVKWISIDSLWWRLKQKHFKNVDPTKEQMREKVYKEVIKHLQSRKRLIIEGVDLLDIYVGLPERYKGMIIDQPMVILGMSAIKAGIRSGQRNRKRGDDKGTWKLLYWMPEYNIRKIMPKLKILRKDVMNLPNADIKELKT
jgi:hypothetical protein